MTYNHSSSNVVHPAQQRRSISSTTEVPDTVIDLTDQENEPNVRIQSPGMYRNDRANVIRLQKPVNNVPSPYNNKNVPSKSSSSHAHVSSSSKSVPPYPKV